MAMWNTVARVPLYHATSGHVTPLLQRARVTQCCRALLTTAHTSPHPTTITPLMFFVPRHDERTQRGYRQATNKGEVKGLGVRTQSIIVAPVNHEQPLAEENANFIFHIEQLPTFIREMAVLKHLKTFQIHEILLVLLTRIIRIVCVRRRILHSRNEEMQTPVEVGSKLDVAWMVSLAGFV
ncbi:hypothetical protein J6590_077683 [Homalodisca vitripennis]|nr:hypothetical protein J6590_077683 [Homalodisca vitripennis]